MNPVHLTVYLDIRSSIEWNPHYSWCRQCAQYIYCKTCMHNTFCFLIHVNRNLSFNKPKAGFKSYVCCCCVLLYPTMSTVPKGKQALIRQAESPNKWPSPHNLKPSWNNAEWNRTRASLTLPEKPANALVNLLALRATACRTIEKNSCLLKYSMSLFISF